MSTCTFPFTNWNTIGSPVGWNTQNSTGPWFNNQGWNPWQTPFNGFFNQPFGWNTTTPWNGWNCFGTPNTTSGFQNWNTPSSWNTPFGANWNTPFGWNSNTPSFSNWNTPSFTNWNWSTPFNGFGTTPSFGTPYAFGWNVGQNFSSPFGQQPNFFWQPYQGFNAGVNGQAQQPNFGINREAA